MARPSLLVTIIAALSISTAVTAQEGIKIGLQPMNAPLATIPRPKERPPVRPSALILQDEIEVEVPLKVIIDGSASLEEVVLLQIGNDLKSLGSEMAIDELNRFARDTLAIERPDLFRLVMVAQVDAHWAGLSDARTALNMIAWLPDTADYLAARITAARLAISEDQLPEIEAERLWRDLRARVERVGDDALLDQLADAMVQSSSAELLVETVTRFHRSDRQRLQSYVLLMQKHGPTAPDHINEMLYGAIVDIREDENFTLQARQIARAYWGVGRHQEALDVLELEPDALLRLRTRFELLAQLEDEVVSDTAIEAVDASPVEQQSDEIADK